MLHGERGLACPHDGGGAATDLGLATMSVAAAAAFTLAGRDAEAAGLLQNARAAVARLADADDRAVVGSLYPMINCARNPSELFPD